jgi:hypothetical protein
MAHIGNEDRFLAFRFQWHVIQRLRIQDLRVCIEVVVQRADPHIAGGQNEIRFIGGAHHVHRA